MAPSDIFDVRGRTAVVTGASSGLGVVFARALASRGANVLLAARRAERLEELAASIREDGGTAHAVPCDVTDAAAVEHLLDEAVGRFGRIDVMVANAGTAGDGGPVPERLPDELFEHTIRVNLLGVWYCCRGAGARMLSDGGGGSLIIVSSVLGTGGQQNYPPAYQASKAGVINLARTLAVSWGDRGVRVNALAPGWFPSEMTEPYFSMPPFLTSIMDQQPSGRLGDPEELVGPLLFLAPDASSYVSGTTLVVDGGMSASYGATRHPGELEEMFAAVIPDGLGRRIRPAFA
ncbi:MAG: SDR family NAD(P)-dependent oxidoreductase [Thermoleophilia bacterium]